MPLKEWIEMVGKVDASDAKEVARMPATKVLGFFKNLLKQREGTRYSTENGTKGSNTLAELELMGKGWMEIWLRAWGY